jgi:hypothetical protein
MFKKSKKMAYTIYFAAIYPYCGFAFSQPLVHKIEQAQQQLLIIGKSLVGVSAIVAILLFIFGKPQWKWFLYILLGGTLLTGIQPIIRWILQ